MGTTQPIRDENDLKRFKAYYQRVKPNPRNDLLVSLCLFSALRIGDILTLRYEDVYDYERGRIRTHIRRVEQKTGKESLVRVNPDLQRALLRCARFRGHQPEEYLLPSRKFPGSHISRFQAYRIIREAAASLGIQGAVSPHSLRKTFGYHAWKQGISPVLLMNIYNHSSFKITKRYLGIEQDDRDAVFLRVRL